MVVYQNLSIPISHPSTSLVSDYFIADLPIHLTFDTLYTIPNFSQ